MDLELIRNNIIFRLISKGEFDRLTKKAEETKDKFPFRKWNDLYLIYKSMLPVPPDDLVTTMLISNFFMKRLKLTEEELYQFAKANTAKTTGVIINPLLHTFEDSAVEPSIPPIKNDVWNFADKLEPSVLTNRDFVNGAALILCDEVMDKIIEYYQVNVLYILPSSAHEVIIVPEDESVDIEYLKSMVRETNRYFVSEEDKLSDHIYKYTGVTKTFEML